MGTPIVGKLHVDLYGNICRNAWIYIYMIIYIYIWTFVEIYDYYCILWKCMEITVCVGMKS